MDALIQKAWDCLHEVKDPELPAIDVVELGIVRAIVQNSDALQVTVTPTYSGCPAMTVIKDEMLAALKKNGFDPVEINTVYAPAWTTDWLSPQTKEKLKSVGIAPPMKGACANMMPFSSPTTAIACPYCDSQQTVQRSEFGSTACKAIYFCNQCQQPFDHFKAF